MPGSEKEYKYWDKRANIFDDASLYVVGNTINGEIRDWLTVQFKDTDVVLELGCGTGTYSQMIVNIVKHLTATDLSPEMIEQARKNLNPRSNVKLQIEDCYQTSFEDNMFNCVLTVNLLHIVKEPITVLKESHRVLKDDGKVVIVDLTGYGMPFFKMMKMGFRYLKKWGKPAPYNNNLNPDKLTEIAEEAGFTVEESKLIGKDTKAVCLKGRRVKQ